MAGYGVTGVRENMIEVGQKSFDPLLVCIGACLWLKPGFIWEKVIILYCMIKRVIW